MMLSITKHAVKYVRADFKGDWPHARNGRGKLVIAYHSLDELDGILERIR